MYPRQVVRLGALLVSQYIGRLMHLMTRGSGHVKWLCLISPSLCPHELMHIYPDQ